MTQNAEKQQGEEIEEKLRRVEEEKQMLEAKLAAATTRAATTGSAAQAPQQQVPYDHYQHNSSPAHPTLKGMLFRACGAKNYVSKQEFRREMVAERRYCN